MTINFPNLVKHFKTDGTYTVTRKQAATYLKGRLVSPETTTFSITASVQPLTGNDMVLLPEGSRSGNTKVLFTTTQLNTVGTAEPDTIVIESVDYDVFNVETWEGFNQTYYRTLVRKVD